MRSGKQVPDWLLWMVLSICALTIFVVFAQFLLGVTSAR